MSSTNLNIPKKIAVLTMARNAEFFLCRWIEYYGKAFGKENLYVFLDGEDQKIPENSNTVNIQLLKHSQEDIVKADNNRIAFLNKVSEKLLEKYDIVIGTDVDEFLILEPNINGNLKDYISKKRFKTSISALGIDVGQCLSQESEIDNKKQLLQQRSYALISSRYSKAIIKRKNVNWGAGFHRIKRKNFHIDKNLYLFHFGSCDEKMILNSFSDKEKIQSNWEKHLHKRMKVIILISKKTAYNFDKTVKVARVIQSIFRPIYAWNKPSMLGLKLVVKIPERFKNTKKEI
jgi:hypothetical protein